MCMGLREKTKDPVGSLENCSILCTPLGPCFMSCRGHDLQVKTVFISVLLLLLLALDINTKRLQTNPGVDLDP